VILHSTEAGEEEITDKGYAVLHRLRCIAVCWLLGYGLEELKQQQAIGAYSLL